jgi:cell division protein FtsW
MKLALVLFGADLLTKKVAAKVPAKQVAAPFAVVTGVAALLVIAQPDLGTGLVLIVISAVMLYTVGLPRAFLTRAFLAIMALIALAAVALPYRRARLLSFINPGSKSDGSGYQVVQSLIGLGSGNLSGLGLGNSREKWGLLPNAHTDFIFSVIGEELGLIGVLAVLVLVGALAMKGYRSVDQAHDLYGKLLASAITTWIIAEAIVNVGAAIGVLPVTGIPLPFVSFGGTSLIVTMAAAGILVNVARQGDLPKRRRTAAPRAAGARRPRPAATR